MDFFVDYYLQIKAFHVVAFMSWMAMLFYLPRLFVYHVEYKDKKDFVEVVEIQERLLYKAIGFPAFVATLISGMLLIVINMDLLKFGWMHVKILFLILLIAYSFSLEYYRKSLLAGTCKRSGGFFRAYNEVPTALAIIIVVHVVLKEIYPIFSIATIVVFGIIAYIILRHNKHKN